MWTVTCTEKDLIWQYEFQEEKKESYIISI